jgi:hypothetical protein
MSDTTKRSWFQQTGESIRRDPVSEILIVTIIATFVYFFGFVPLFIKGLFVRGIG